MAITFPAAANINNVPFPFSLAGFGTRPNNNASVALVGKGSPFIYRDNSASVNNETLFQRQATAVDARADSTTLWTVANGNVHFAVTVSAAGAVKVYRAAVQTSYSFQSSGSGSLTSDAASDLIVTLNSVSHFAFWNVELTSGNITSLYNGGAGVDCYTVQPTAILVSTDISGGTAALGVVAPIQQRIMTGFAA